MNYGDYLYKLPGETLKIAHKAKGVQTSAPHSYTCSYQQLSNKTFLKIATHRYSPSKMNGSYALILTCEYATPTSYIRISVLYWTKRPSELTKLIKKTINELLLTLLAACTARAQ